MMKEVSDIRGIYRYYIREKVVGTCMEIWAWDDTHMQVHVC